MSASSSAHAASPRRARPLPAVDERLVMPETRYEAINGKITYVAPADEPHGTFHSKLAALLIGHVVARYDVAVDMLTRTSEKDDMAPDASVFPAARDPKTGGRQLEELAFEVVSTERLSHAAQKARALAERGVRRVFAVDVARRRVLSWSRRTGAWKILATRGAIEDRTLALPLPHQALADAMKVDDALAHALLAKKNPVIEGALSEARADGVLEGMLDGKTQALVQILAARGLRITKTAERRIRAERDEATVDRWLGGALSCRSVDALLGKP